MTKPKGIRCDVNVHWSVRHDPAVGYVALASVISGRIVADTEASDCDLLAAISRAADDIVKAVLSHPILVDADGALIDWSDSALEAAYERRVKAGAVS
jgi:hypothetical protein